MRERIRLGLLFSIIGLAVGCGDVSSTEEAVTIQGVAVESTSRGLAFAGISEEAALSTSDFYFYDFSSTEIKRVLSGGSSDPAPFLVEEEILLFNRHSSAQNLVRVDTEDWSVGEEVEIEGMKPGDPSDATLIAGTENVLLALPGMGELGLFDRQLEELTIVEADWSSISTSFRPMGVRVRDETVSVVHSGVDSQGHGDGTQKLLRFPASGLPDLSAAQTEVSSVTPSATVPTGWIDLTSESVLAVGLCLDADTSCTAAVDTYDLESGELSTGVNLDELGYHLKGGVIAGPSGTIYAHVQSGAAFAIIAIDISSDEAAVTEIHAYDSTEDGLYGLFYDSPSDTLFVGAPGMDGGKLVLYRAHEKVAEIELPTVPYSGLVVPAS